MEPSAGLWVARKKVSRGIHFDELRVAVTQHRECERAATRNVQVHHAAVVRAYRIGSRESEWWITSSSPSCPSRAASHLIHSVIVVSSERETINQQKVDGIRLYLCRGWKPPEVFR